MAIKAWEAKNEQKAEESTEVKLMCQIPPISKLDGKVLNGLKNCKYLSFSSNAIDRMIGLGGMSKLTVLSLGRNNIKKLEKLDEVAGTLEQLWISYNSVTSLEGLSCLTNLTTLYCSNNQIKSFSELDHLVPLEKLKDVLFVGNPMYDDATDRAEAKLRVLKRLPKVTKIDGDLVKESDREAGSALVD